MFRNNFVKPLSLIQAIDAMAWVTVLLLVSLATAQAGQVTLAWNASNPSTGVTGYHVVYGQASNNYTTQVDAGNSTQYTVANLEDGKTYYFAVHAHDAGDTISSANSNEVSKTLPAVAPTASFSAGVTSGTAPLTVAFTNSSSGTAPLTYSWSFGDGSTSTASSPSKVYTSAGTYTVILTVTGPGGSNTLTRTNYITVTNPTVTAPVASFSATPTSGTAPLVVTLVDTSTGTITSRTWELGDGTTSNTQSVSKTYTAGTYTVKLTVSNGAVSSTTTKTISATAATPVANFTVSPSSGVAPLPVTFTNTSTGATSYSWNFGDNTTSTAQNPTKTYANAGTYAVTLTATGSSGTTPSTKTQTITVTAASASTGGLVAAYDFGEASGTTVVDASGKGNHGTINGATRTTSGKSGNALSFDGVNDWVTVNDSATLDLTNGMTLEAWVYPTTISGNRTVLVKENAPDSVYYLYANTADDSFNTPLGGGVFASQYQFAHGGSTLATNAWSHVAVTYDGAIERLYVNGAQVASKAQTGNMTVSGGALRIGGNSLWGEFFKGSIDEVRLYNRALSATEIKTDMNTAVVIASKPEPLLGESTIGTVAASSLPQKMAMAFQITATVTGKVTSLPVYVNAGSASTNLVAGIYTDSSGRPGTLLGQGSLSSPKAGSWNTVLLPAISVNSGTKYWVAILSPSGALSYKTASVARPSETSKVLTLTTLPSTWATGTVSTSGSPSAYGAGYR